MMYHGQVVVFSGDSSFLPLFLLEMQTFSCCVQDLLSALVVFLVWVEEKMKVRVFIWTPVSTCEHLDTHPPAPADPWRSPAPPAAGRATLWAAPSASGVCCSWSGPPPPGPAGSSEHHSGPFSSTYPGRSGQTPSGSRPAGSETWRRAELLPARASASSVWSGERRRLCFDGSHQHLGSQNMESDGEYLSDVLQTFHWQTKFSDLQKPKHLGKFKIKKTGMWRLTDLIGLYS